MKRSFQICLVALNLVPFATGVLAAVTGAALFAAEPQITADFDAQIRVYGIWFTAIFFLSVWMAFNVETCGPVLRIVFSLVALAGVARVYTMVAMGEFPVTTAVGAVIEIAMLGFIPWHRHVLTRLRHRPRVRPAHRAHSGPSHDCHPPEPLSAENTHVRII